MSGFMFCIVVCKWKGSRLEGIHTEADDHTYALSANYRVERGV